MMNIKSEDLSDDNRDLLICHVSLKLLANKKKSLKGHCHKHNFKNSTAQKHVHTTGNLLTAAKFS